MKGPIGILTAVTPELEAVKKVAETVRSEISHGVEFWLGTIHGMDCVMVETGVWKVNAARVTQVLINDYQPIWTVNIGTTGGLAHELAIGDIIFAESLVQSDFDRSAVGSEIGHVPNLKSAYIACDPRLLAGCRRVKESMRIEHEGNNQYKISIGVIATMDVFKITLERAKELRDTFGALAIDMEGAAIAHICELCDVPFIAIRALSNKITGKDKDEENFWTFRASVSKHCASIMVKLIEEMKGIM